MFHRVKAVSPIPHTLSLLVDFISGETKTYDIEPLFEKWPCFKVFADDRVLFRSVRVDTGGYGVIWNDDLDLSCDELYENGEELSGPYSTVEELFASLNEDD